MAIKRNIVLLGVVSLVLILCLNCNIRESHEKINSLNQINESSRVTITSHEQDQTITPFGKTNDDTLPGYDYDFFNSSNDIIENPDSAYVILVPGGFHGDEAPFDSDTYQNMFALKQLNEGDFSLIPVKVEIKKAYDPIFGDSSGIDVITPENTMQFAIALFQSKKNVFKQGPLPKLNIRLKTHDGKIQTYYQHPKSRGDSLWIDIAKGHKYLITVVKEFLVEREVGYPEKICAYAIHDLTENINSINDDPIFGIIWMGDLDRDGKLDIIREKYYHYNVYVDLNLYLSSKALPGKLYKYVCSVIHQGC